MLIMIVLELNVIFLADNDHLINGNNFSLQELLVLKETALPFLRILTLLLCNEILPHHAFNDTLGGCGYHQIITLVGI